MSETLTEEERAYLRDFDRDEVPRKALRVIDELESRLAAATALLETAPGMPGFRDGWPSWCERNAAFLANQPAAPTRAEALGKLTRPGASPWDERERARLEAEQAVLDAMAGLPEGDVKAWSVCPLQEYRRLGEAELARRGLIASDD